MTTWRIGRSDRVAIFLGAGASVPLGFPTTAGILNAIREGLRPGLTRKTKPDWRKRAESRDRHFARDLRGFLDYVLPGISRSPPGRTDISIIDVLSLLDRLVIDQRSLGEAWPVAALPAARRALDLAINGVMQGRRKRGLRDDFVSTILRLKARCKRVSIISTNYDIAYELPLYRALAERYNEVAGQVDMGTTFRTPGGVLYHRSQTARLAVFKLHGSLNWLQCEVCGHLYVNTRQRIASLEFWTKRTVYNTCDCEGLLRSVLVTPSLVRDVREPNLLSIWNAAIEDLRSATHWVFIGYSLPQEDVSIRSLLLRAYHGLAGDSLKVKVAVLDEHELQARGTLPPPWAYRHAGLATPAPNPARARYRSFFPRPVFDDSGDYFPGGVEDVLEALSDVSST